LQAIEASIKSLSEGGAPRILLFTGEPGIGKSRLLEAVADAAAQAGSNVVAGRCFEAEMIRPYGLWIDALGSFSDPAFAGSSFEVAVTCPVFSDHA
jgi:predicted ATPase